MFRLLLLTVSLALCAISPLWANGKVQRIGVLANRGPEECLARWNPTAQALSASLHESFQIVPLGFQEVDDAVRNKRVDYIIVNSGQYVALEKHYEVQRLATLKNQVLGRNWSVFGSVIFTRADRSDITSFASVRGKRVMAVEPDSFGGWLAAARELKAAGLVAGRHFEVQFGGTQDAPLRAVLERKADVGIIRTDLLEVLAAEGKVNLKDLRVLPHPSIDEPQFEDLPLLHSTRLYPEWPFAKLKATPLEDAERVLLALLSIKAGSPAAKAAHYGGWTVPLDYQSVHQCLIDLRHGPYADYGKIRGADVLRSYWPWFLVALGAFIVIILVATHLHRLNLKVEKAMIDVRTLSGLLPICAWCKRIRSEDGGWSQVEDYVRKHSEAQFTHSICPDCTGKFNPDGKG